MRRVATALALLATVHLTARADPPPPPSRPAAWATPVSRPGLPNLQRVSDSYWRGGQPTPEGMQELAKLGVRTVINLRVTRSDREELAELPLGYEHIRFNPWDAEEEQVVRFLRIVTDARRQPVFVHCHLGSDRTGMMTAIYRIVVQGRSKQDAIAEMTQGGFGFNAIWTNLVRYLQELDVERLRRAVAGAISATMRPPHAAGPFHGSGRPAPDPRTHVSG